jgi:hypothetical protein
LRHAGSKLVCQTGVSPGCQSKPASPNKITHPYQKLMKANSMN